MAAETSKKRRRESGENQTGKGIFSDDMIRGVLERLPAKGLGRFRCLSKHWLSYLSDPEFIKRQAIKAKENPIVPLKLFCCLIGTKSSLYKLNTETHIDDLTGIPFNIPNAEEIELPAWEQRGPSALRMVGCANGLVCLQPPLTGRVVTFFLLNPLTGESRQFSFTPSNAFANQSTNLGFAYDSSSEDYKIIRVTYIHEYVTDVFSLKNNCWKTIPHVTPRSLADRRLLYMLRDPSVEVAGFLHWEVMGHRDGNVISPSTWLKRKLGSSSLMYLILKLWGSASWMDACV